MLLDHSVGTRIDTIKFKRRPVLGSKVEIHEKIGRKVRGERERERERESAKRHWTSSELNRSQMRETDR